MSAWYDLTPVQYAIGCRYKADRSDEVATYKTTEGKPWSRYDEELFRRQARRLRAMATLCDRSTATSAGDVDFLRLNDPTLDPEDEDAAIAKINSEAGPI